MDTKGKHYIAEMWGIEENRLDNIKDIETKMVEAAKAANGTVLNVYGHKFSPQGVSVVVTISESHLSIHTFPEHNYCAVDIYTCGNTQPEKAIEFLLNYFQPKNKKVLELVRGLKQGIKLKELP